MASSSLRCPIQRYRWAVSLFILVSVRSQVLTECLLAARHRAAPGYFMVHQERRPVTALGGRGLASALPWAWGDAQVPSTALSISPILRYCCRNWQVSIKSA